MTPIIQPKELLEMTGRDDLLLVDARGGTDAKATYLKRHLQGAVFADLETDLSDIKPDPKDGGRHPLPDPARFASFLREMGFSHEKHLVVYDDRQGAMAAARFWWMMRAAGFDQLQVLNGGLEAAIEAGVPVCQKHEHKTGRISTDPSHEYIFETWALPQAGMDEVEEACGDPQKLIIDVREAERYRGETEPYDLVAGHIPGAINMFYGRNLDENGRFLPPELLRSMYKEVIGNRAPGQIIVHCGSGVTACHTLLAMDYAGISIPKLYVGSYSEWIRNDKPIEG